MRLNPPRLVRGPPRGPSDADVFGEVLAGQGRAVGHQIARTAFEHDATAVVTGARAEVDDPVGVRHHGLVVLDDDDGDARVDQAVEEAEKVLDVGKVEPGGGLVEDVDAALACHVSGQLQALALAARQRREGLAETQVAEADVVESLENRACGGHGRVALGEEVEGLVHREVEDLADVEPAVGVDEHRGVVPLALAVLAGGGDSREDRELGVDDAGAVAGGASAFGVGTEECGFDVIRLGECLADGLEQTGVGGRVAPSGALDRTLVDRDDVGATRE